MWLLSSDIPTFPLRLWRDTLFVALVSSIPATCVSFLPTPCLDWSLSSSLPSQYHILCISAFFYSHSHKKLEIKKRVPVIFLCRFPTACSPGWNRSFPQHSTVASCIFVLFSSQKAHVVGGNTALFLSTGPEKCFIVNIKDQAMGNRLPNSHHELHKYYFHLAWPFIVL